MTRTFPTVLAVIATLVAGCASHRTETTDACVCIDLRTSDAGPLPRSCGGFAEVECLATEYCDYPDTSSCGGDDSPGVCTPRPVGCPDPGGVPVCACDGMDYLDACSANLAGVDIRNVGPCTTSSAYRTAKADRDCGPSDGPAWTFTLTTARTSCAEVRTDGAITISIWTALEGAMADTTYAVGGGVTGGQASVCGAPGAPCATMMGTVVVHSFTTSGVALFDYDLRAADGRRFAETNIAVTPWWCDVTGPICG